MMRRFFSVFLSVILLASQISFFTSCESVKEKQKFSEYYFDYFDTVTTITGYTETEEEFKSICEEIKTELECYHKLYNIYLRYDGINNICVINDVTDGKHNVVTVDKKIIDLAEKELYVIRKFFCNYPEITIEEYYETLHGERQKLIVPVEEPIEQFIERVD